MMNTAVQFIETPLGKILIRASAPSGTCVSIQLIEPDASLPRSSELEHVMAALLHVKTTEEVKNYFYECIWMSDPPVHGLGIGQNIETWEKNGYCLTMGTEDEQTLQSRLPYAGFLTQSQPVQHTNRGLLIKVPHLPAQTDTTLHFITAWDTKKGLGECPPSPASGISHLALLNKEQTHKPELPC